MPPRKDKHDRPEHRRRGDPYGRDRDEDSYGQYGGLDRGLGYGGGRDLDELGHYGPGREPDRLPPHGPGGRWRRAGPGWDDEFGSERGRGERGFMERAADEVSSWFGDEAAARRREADHRGKGPRGYRRSDARIEEDVNDRLTDDPYVDASDIAVAVQDGEVTLTGTVDSRQAKRRAEDCAEGVSGVQHVQNNLRVRRPDPTPPSGAG